VSAAYDRQAVFFEAISLPPEKREAFLETATGGDPKERDFLERMVATHESDTHPLDGGLLAIDPEEMGPYDIHGRLGEGGMGIVYLAKHRILDRLDAVKVLAPELSRDPNRIRRFQHEGRILAKLDHPHIARVYDFGEHHGNHYVAMQFIDGPTLAELLHDGPLELGDALDLLIEIGEGLVEAHGEGIIHRDLKPQNILLHPTQGAKIVDFGIATSLGDTEPGSNDSVPRPAVTSTIGTPEYASPEQLRREESDERTDIWAFGCVAYECLTGRRAFRGTAAGRSLLLTGAESDTEARAGAVRGGGANTGRSPSPDPAIDWSSLPDNVLPSLRETLVRCLRLDRDERWPSMGDVLSQLRQIRQQAAGAALPDDARPTLGRRDVKPDAKPHPQAPPQRPLSRWKRPGTLLALLLALLLPLLLLLLAAERGWIPLGAPTRELAVVTLEGTRLLRGVDTAGEELWVREMPGEVITNVGEKLGWTDRPFFPFLILDRGHGQEGVIISVFAEGEAGRILDLDPLEGLPIWSRELTWIRPQNDLEVGHPVSLWQRKIRGPSTESADSRKTPSRNGSGELHDPADLELLLSVRNGKWYQDSVHRLSLTGETLASYYHPGLLYFAGQFSFGDSVDRAVLLIGDNSSARYMKEVVPFDTKRHCGAAILLDPARIAGQAYPYAPEGLGRDWPGIPPAKEIGYLVVPPIHPDDDAAVVEFEVDTTAGTIKVRTVDGRMYFTDARLRPKSLFIPTDCPARDRLSRGESVQLPVLYIHDGKREFIDLEYR